MHDAIRFFETHWAELMRVRWIVLGVIAIAVGGASFLVDLRYRDRLELRDDRIASLEYERDAALRDIQASGGPLGEAKKTVVRFSMHEYGAGKLGQFENPKHQWQPRIGDNVTAIVPLTVGCQGSSPLPIRKQADIELCNTIAWYFIVALERPMPCGRISRQVPAPNGEPGKAFVVNWNDNGRGRRVCLLRVEELEFDRGYEVEIVP